MSPINKSMMAALLLLGAGAFVVPAVAQNGGGMMIRGMGSDGTMRGTGSMTGRGMAGGCMQMMQGMRNGGSGGRPNEQWRQQQPSPDER